MADRVSVCYPNQLVLQLKLRQTGKLLNMQTCRQILFSTLWRSRHTVSHTTVFVHIWQPCVWSFRRHQGIFFLVA